MDYVQILTCSSELGNCCSDPGMIVTLNVMRNLTGLVQLVVPILLMIMASLEFVRLARDPDRKGGTKRVINMFKAAAIVFFIPMFIDVLLGALPTSMSLSSCWEQSKSRAESMTSSNFTYIAPYDTGKKNPVYTDPSEYEKGVPKPKDDDCCGDDSGTGSGTGTGTIAPGDAQGILDGAEKVHTMYEQYKWAYYSDLSQLKWGNINYSTNNPSKMTCCATFVGSALYVGGVFSEATLNKYNYNSQYGISKLCQEAGWTKITSYSQLAAGDIVIMSGPSGGSKPGHVQIYAGNGTWYNAGSTNAIQRDNPYSSDASARFLWAWRKPA